MDLSLPSKSPRLALAVAELLNAVQSPAGAQLIDSRLSTAIGETPVSVHVQATNQTPAWYAARCGGYSFLLIGGCSAMSHASGVVDGFRGVFLGPVDEPVNAYVRDVGERIKGEALANGLLAGPDLILAGHSLGGSAAEHVAYSLLQSRGGAALRLLTFGAPKPGGPLFAAAVADIDRTRWFCTDDPVPLLPPTADLLPGILLAHTPIELMRFNNFVHPRGGCEISVEANIGKGVLPQLATLNATASLAGWLLAVDGSSSSGHHLTTYQSRLAYWIQQHPETSPTSIEVAVAEEPGDVTRTQVGQQQKQAGRLLSALASDALDEPTVIPQGAKFLYQRSGRFHLVIFNGRTVVATSRERSARKVAREGNEWLRTLQRQAVVMTDELAAQFVTYLQLATSEKSGFTPRMNNKLPELPA